MKNSGYLTVELNNGKSILINPNYLLNKCFYKYLTKEEIDSNSVDIETECEGWNEVSMTTEINPAYSNSINCISVDGQLIKWNYNEVESKIAEEYLKMHHLARFVH